jgi:enoyl-CoA hydratase/carnithine racemase
MKLGEESLLVSKADGVLTLRMNRPHSANALNDALQTSLAGWLAHADSAIDVGCVVVDSVDSRIFSAGIDLKEHLQVDPMTRAHRRREQLLRTLTAILDCGKPIVACVNGKAIGAGCMLALAADEIYAGDSAAFSMPEIDLGMPTPTGASLLLERHGHHAMHELVMAGRKIDGKRALDLRLIHGIADTENLGELIALRAGELSRRKQPAYSQTKKWINRDLVNKLIAASKESARLASEGR